MPHRLQPHPRPLLSILAAIPQRKLYYRRYDAGALAWAHSAPTTSPPARLPKPSKGAAAAGYRHFDCASVYGNEAEIGASLERILRGGIKREELWITSKLWNDKHGEDDVIASCRKSLADLRLELPRSLPGALAVSELPSAGLRR